METIKEQTPQEQLIIFRNEQLREFIGALIHLEQIKQYREDEVVGFRRMPQHGGTVASIEVKAKEMAKNEEINIKSRARFLIAIEKVAEQFKKTPKLWETLCQK